MTITALPSDTCWSLGSAALISTPLNFIKELVDNAIDAGATSIEVFVSPNTVDKVEVRDNGHGIAVKDFDALGRRGHTSKLRQIGDLKTVGSTSLGFRGEGLASINSLGYVSITTRTVNDAVATTFRLVPNLGGISSGSQKHASAPVGTTVSIACLFSVLPVRRKVAVREAAKTVAAIKTLMCGYALARPHLRLVFKVYRQAASAWYYCPAASGVASSSPADRTGIKRTISLLFGADMARQYQDIVISSKELLSRQSTLFQSLSRTAEANNVNFIFEACLPLPSASVSKFRFGGFVSVDGRPLSAQHHGTAKKLLAIFHTSFDRSLKQYEPQQPRLCDIFIRLNIKCPIGSYDANADSSKTDVLFTDEKLLCDTFETLCKKLYVDIGPLQAQKISGQVLYSMPQRPQEALSIARTTSYIREVARTQIRNCAPPQQCIRAKAVQKLPMLSNENTKRTTAPLSSSEQLPVSQFKGTSTGTPATLEQHSKLSGTPVQYNISPVEDRKQHDSSPSPLHISTSTPWHPWAHHHLPTRGLRTPPSSPVGEFQARANRRGRDLSGLESCDGLRQTTIAFIGPAGVTRQQRVGISQMQEFHYSPPTRETERGTARLLSFVSAKEQCGAEENLHDGKPQSSEGVQQRYRTPSADVLSSARATRPSRGSRRANSILRHDKLKSQSRPPAEDLLFGRSGRTLEVDIQKLRRSAVTFARNVKAWEEDLDYLSPEMADVSGIEDRLRAAITAWLEKTRLERTSAGGGQSRLSFT